MHRRGATRTIVRPPSPGLSEAAAVQAASSSDAFSAEESAASPLTSSFQDTSKPLRCAFLVIFSPLPSNVTTKGLPFRLISRFSGLSSLVMLHLHCGVVLQVRVLCLVWQPGGRKIRRE